MPGSNVRPRFPAGDLVLNKHQQNHVESDVCVRKLSDLRGKVDVTSSKVDSVTPKMKTEKKLKRMSRTQHSMDSWHWSTESDITSWVSSSAYKWRSIEDDNARRVLGGVVSRMKRIDLICTWEREGERRILIDRNDIIAEVVVRLAKRPARSSGKYGIL